MSTILETALDYANHGLEVFPVPPGTKKSYKSKKYSPDGKRWGATKNADTIRSYWAEHPDANLGVPTGAGNGFWVLEFDTPEGHGVDGAASLATLEAEFGPLPATRQAESPSGSVHFYFLHPGFDIVGTPGIRPGIDIRGDGNMVLAPPSIKPGVGAYKWSNELPVADAPPWLLDLVKTAAASAAAIERAPVNIPPPPPGATPVEKALHTEYHKVAQASEGTRNHQLNASAFKLGRHVGAGELDEEVAIQMLVNACKVNGSFAEDAGECHGTIHSGLTKGKGNPVDTVHSMFGAAVAAQAAIDAAKAAGTVSPSIVPDEAPQQLIDANTPVPGGPNVAAAEPREYEPAGGLMKRLGDWMAEFTALDFLWEDILLRKFIYGLTASTGTGKTAIAMLLAASVALGQKLCSRDIEKGQVIYLAGENPVDVQMRFHGQCQVMEVDPHALDIYVIPSTFEFKDSELVRAECEANNLKPSLVIVDTLAAYFPTDDDNHNVQMGNYIRTLRTLCTLPGEPCVLVLCHPVKGAKAIDEMVPRGGGAAINELDGNLGAAVGEGGLVAVQKVVKFRGAPFDPLYFKTWVVHDHPHLKTTKGKQLKTVVAREVTDQGAAVIEKAAETDDIRLLRDIDAHPGDDLRKRGVRLGCNASTVSRRIEKLAGPKRKLVDNSGVTVKLTAKGQKELNALEVVQQSATSVVPFPPYSGA
jgi:hypothetical protein